MAYEESNGHVIDDVTWPWKVKFVSPIRLERNISKTAVDAILATIVNYSLVCCEAVRSAIMATTWLLVSCYMNATFCGSLLYVSFFRARRLCTALTVLL